MADLARLVVVKTWCICGVGGASSVWDTGMGGGGGEGSGQPALSWSFAHTLSSVGQVSCEM